MPAKPAYNPTLNRSAYPSTRASTGLGSGKMRSTHVLLSSIAELVIDEGRFHAVSIDEDFSPKGEEGTFDPCNNDLRKCRLCIERGVIVAYFICHFGLCSCKNAKKLPAVLYS